MALYQFVILTVFLAVAAAEVVNITPCDGVSQDQCTVSEVRIDPCKFIKGSCKLKRGEGASLSFDFTPNFSASSLKTMVYYGAQEFAGMSTTNACELTSCPTVPGVSQTFYVVLPLKKKLPKGTYPINWKVWNENNPSQVCCFTTGIILM